MVFFYFLNCKIKLHTMTYKEQLQFTRDRNNELFKLLKLIERHPATLNVAVISEQIAGFEHLFLKSLDPDISDRLKNEIVGFLRHQLNRGTRAELELVQLIKDKAENPLQPHDERQTVVPVFVLNHSFHTSNV